MKLLVLFLLFASTLTYAQDEFDEFNADSKQSSNSLLQFNGFVEFEQGARFSNAGPHKNNGLRDDYVLANRRFRLQTSKNFERGGIYGKLDFINDDIENTNTVDIREMRFQYKLSENIDLSVGKQVSTWGVADMLFINDLFPKNWVANFQGRDIEMLKEPSSSVRLTNYISDYILDAVYQPQFTPDITPTGCKFSVFDPNANAVIANKANCETSSSSGRDNSKFNEGELAVSLKRRVGNHELAMYAYKGFYKSPKALKLNGTTFVPFHSKLNVYGFSDEGQFGLGIFTFEAGYYDSLDDKNGNDYLIPNSTLKYLVGYRQDLSGKFSYGVQLYQEKMINYNNYESSYFVSNPSGYQYRKKEIQSTFTLRLTYKLHQETLWLSMFSYLRTDDKDSFTNFEISKKLDDNFKITFGANIFTGDDKYSSREFGMLDDDDNIFTRFNYIF